MPRRYSMTNRAAETDATRRQILGAVVEVAAESGIDALTVQAVAARADVSLRTVYNHFDSREGLVAAALTNLARETRAAVGRIEVADRPAREQVLEFVDAYARSYEEQGPAIRVLMDAAGNPVVADAVGDVRSWRRQQVRRMLRQAQAEGTLQLPMAEAISVSYLLTAYATYASLALDAKLSGPAVRTTLRTMADRTLFGGTEPADAS